MRRTVVVMTNRRGLRHPILGAILLLLSFPSTASLTDRHKHNGPSRVSFQNTSTLGIWVLDQFSDLHDEPAGRTVIIFVTPHLSDFPIFLQQLLYAATYGPSQARRTVISSVGGLFCNFRSKSPRSALDRFLAKQRENYIKLSTNKAFGHSKLKEKVLIIP